MIQLELTNLIKQDDKITMDTLLSQNTIERMMKCDRLRYAGLARADWYAPHIGADGVHSTGGKRNEIVAVIDPVDAVIGEDSVGYYGFWINQSDLEILLNDEIMEFSDEQKKAFSDAL